MWAVSSALFVAATPDSLQNKDYTTIVNKDVLVDKKRVVVYGSTTSSLPWLKSFYDNAHNAESAKQILPLIAGIKELFSEKKYDTVNDILLEMDFKKLSHTAMVAFISATFPARHKLDGWPLSAQLVKVHLLSAGLEADEILHGIV